MSESSLRKFASGLPSVFMWAFIMFGVVTIVMGIYNDLNWGAPWACPGPFFTATNVLECLTEGTLTFEIPLGIFYIGCGGLVWVAMKTYPSTGGK